MKVFADCLDGGDINGSPKGSLDCTRHVSNAEGELIKLTQQRPLPKQSKKLYIVFKRAIVSAVALHQLP